MNQDQIERSRAAKRRWDQKRRATETPEQREKRLQKLRDYYHSRGERGPALLSKDGGEGKDDE
jgi:hypothetical protein